MIDPLYKSRHRSQPLHPRFTVEFPHSRRPWAATTMGCNPMSTANMRDKFPQWTELKSVPNWEGATRAPAIEISSTITSHEGEVNVWSDHGRSGLMKKRRIHEAKAD